MKKMTTILSGAVLATTSVLGATVIVWETPPVAVNTNAPTQVITTGTLVVAASYFTSADPRFNVPDTVNGVTFGTGLETLTTGYSAGGIGTLGDPSGLNNYQKLLDSGLYRQTGSLATVTVSGLTAGKDYVMQVFTPLWNANYPTSFISGPNTVDMGNTAGTPTFVLGHFTADGATQAFDWGASPASGYGLLGALQVREIPEPASLGLAVSAIAGLVLRRRRGERY